ncbi:MAG: M56 family metallopeptidase [Pirellulaceae bacterium]|nr:M56 family metallopeptidase [Pirellulaceae bacterium]
MLNELIALVSEYSLSLFIDATVKTSLILILAIILDRMLARSSAAVRHRIWGLGLWSALLVPILTIILPQWQLPILPQRIAAQSISISEGPIGPDVNSELTRTSQQAKLLTEPSMGSAWTQPEFEQNAFQASSIEIVSTPIETTELNSKDLQTTRTSELNSPDQLAWRINLGLALAIAWAVGVVWKLASILIGLNANHRLIRESKEVQDGCERDLVSSLASRLGMSHPIPIYEADASVVPMTLGILRPVIVVPRDWTEWAAEQRECVLLHELAHIKRLDVAYQLVGCVAAAIHWLNPLVWYALRQLRIERELACDDCVLAAGELPSEYAKQLVVVARAYQPYRPSVSVAMASSARLDDRIRAILDTARSRLPLSRSTAISIALVASLIVLSIVVIRPVARQVNADENTSAELVAKAGDEEPSANSDTSSNPNQAIIVKGVVLKPDGTPAIGATILSTAGVNPAIASYLSADFEAPILKATSNVRGEFEIEVDQHPYGAIPAALDEYWKTLTCISASFDNFGPALMEYASIDPTKPITLQLVDDVPIRGRVIDLEGRPVPNTQIQVATVRTPKNHDLALWLDAVEAGGDAQTLSEHLHRRMLPRELGVTGVLKSDSDGAFEVRGIGRDRVVELAFQSGQVGFDLVLVATREMPALQVQSNPITSQKMRLFGVDFTYTSAPSPPITGIVIDAFTKQPVPDVSVESFWFGNVPFFSSMKLKTKTDFQGRFGLTGYPTIEVSDLLIRPNDEQPYFMRRLKAPDPKKLEPREMKVELHRGIWITGRVIDQVTKEPVAGVWMHYFPWRTNEFAKALPEFDEYGTALGDQARYQTDKDGNYRLLGLPGPAIVGARSSLKSYRFGKGYEEAAKITPLEKGAESAGWLATYGNPVNPAPKTLDAILSINPSAETEAIELHFELDPGAKIQMNLVDASYQPLAGARVLGLKPIDWETPTPQTNSDVEAICFGPEEERTIVALHAKRKLGIVSVAGPKQVNEGKMRLQLLPMATVTGRLEKNGEPLPGIRLESRVLPDGDFPTQLDYVTTNKEGHFTIEMDSGCKYKIYANGPGIKSFATFAEELTVKPGEAIDLGTLVLSKDNKFVSEIRSIEKSNSARKQKNAEKQIAVKGIVLKPDGTPAVGATVRSTAGVNWPLTKYVAADSEPPIATTVSNERGLFEILLDQHPYGELPTEAEEYWKKFALITATSDGYGPAVLEYASIDPSKTFTLRLVEDVPIRGRVIDLEGRSIANTRIHVKSIRSAKGVDLSSWLLGVEAGEDSQTLSKHLVRRIPPREFGFEKDLISGTDGSFELRGIGRDRVVEIAFQSDQVGLEVVMAVARNMPASAIPKFMSMSKAPHVRVFGAEFTYTATPSPPITGIVVDSKTKEPLPNVSVEIFWFTNESKSQAMQLKTETDSQGHFRLTGYPTIDPRGLLFRPSDDQPYLMRKVLPPDAKNLEPREMTVELHRGLWIKGRVTDQVTKEPVPGVTMLYQPWRTNPFAQSLPDVDESLLGHHAGYKTDKNGNFRFPGLPGPAIVGAAYALKPYRQGKGYDEAAKITPMGNGTSGYLAVYGDTVSPQSPEAILSINPSSDTETVELNFELDPGEKIQIELVDEMDKPVVDGRILGLIPHDNEFHNASSGNKAHVFESVGFAPDEVRSIIALHASRKLGFSTTVGPEQTKEGSLRIKLLPIATVTGRLVSNNEPIPDLTLEPRILPEESSSPILERVKGDEEGRFKIELPSGCKYIIYAFGPGLKRFATFAEELTVKPGQILDLGTLTLGEGIGEGHQYFRAKTIASTESSSIRREE